MINQEHQSSSLSETLVTLCNTQECPAKTSCARFYDPLRKEHKDLDLSSFELRKWDWIVEDCFVLRIQLQGTMDNQRHYAKTTKNHRRKKGEWA